jgi:hypothetical protein
MGMEQKTFDVDAVEWKAGRTTLRSLCALGLMLLVQGALPGGAAAAPSPSGAFEICEDQRYALCATASCFVFNGVAYCNCDVEMGDSISAPYDFEGGDVCSVNAQGVGNGYMVSTYSLPASVVAGGDSALYTCRGSSADGAYAQCDGGLCFTSTRGQSFPGFDQPLSESEIICSCPITVADPSRPLSTYQIIGPFPCQQPFFENCNDATANDKTGSTIYVGAPAGVGRLLTRELDGTVPQFNHCSPQG